MINRTIISTLNQKNPKKNVKNKLGFYRKKKNPKHTDKSTSYWLKKWGPSQSHDLINDIKLLLTGNGHIAVFAANGDSICLVVVFLHRVTQTALHVFKNGILP